MEFREKLKKTTYFFYFSAGGIVLPLYGEAVLFIYCVHFKTEEIIARSFTYVLFFKIDG